MDKDKRSKCPVCGRFAKKEAVDAHHETLDALKGEVKDKDFTIASLTQQLEALKSDNSTLNEELAHLGESLAKMQKGTDALRSELDDRKKRIEDLEQDIERYRSRGLWARILNKD